MFKNMIRRGFTLVEMIVVLVIVAILGAIAIAGYQKVVEKAEVKAAESTLQTLDREYRALDAFNLGTAAQGVDADDLSVITGVTVADVNNNGVIDKDDTATYADADGTDLAVLTFGSATVAGTLSAPAGS